MMDWIARSVLFLLIVIDQQLQTTPATPKATTEIYYDFDGICLIHGTTIKSTIKRTRYCKSMDLISVNITQPSKELFDSLADGLEFLNVHRSNVAAVYVPYNLINLDISGEDQTKIIIDRNATYKLQSISLERLSQFPSNVGSLRSLKDFRCDRIHAAIIDLQIFAKTAHLEQLIITESGSVTVPNPLQFLSLRKLEIYDSVIKTSGGASCNIPKLEMLDLQNNSLKVIPECFKTLKNLKLFYVNQNQLQRVALDDFANLKLLETLDLSENQLSELTTKRVILLPRLQTLNLHKNKLIELNVKMWMMPALRFLSLDDNQLKQVAGLVPFLIRNAPSLQLYDNPWDCLWMNETLQQFPGIQVSIPRDGPCFPIGSSTMYDY